MPGEGREIAPARVRRFVSRPYASEGFEFASLALLGLALGAGRVRA